MMPATRGNVLTLGWGLRVKARVQHPQVKPRKDRQGWPWVFRYWYDEIQPGGSIKTLRKYQAVGPSKGEGALTKKEAEVGRDKFLAKLNAPTLDMAVEKVAATGIALFGEVAKMYEEGYLGRENQIAEPTRVKEKFYLTKYIIPRWGEFRLNQIQPRAVEDWLHTTFDSWWATHGVRAIMSRIYHYAEGHGLWEEGRRNPPSKAKLGKKRYKNERRILSFEETARVLARLEEPNKLIIETCIATGARISEVLGLKWMNVNLEAETIKIEHRVWHQEVGRPKSENSRRVLGLGDLARRFREKATKDSAKPEEWVFCQKRAPEKPLWDSGVRDALHQAAEAEGCDFPGLGPHSFRRANISWRQQVGGSAIEASKIAGHSDLEMTSEYTFVAPERQNELTRRIQEKLADAARKGKAAGSQSLAQDVLPGLAAAKPATQSCNDPPGTSSNGNKTARASQLRRTHRCVKTA